MGDRAIRGQKIQRHTKRRKHLPGCWCQRVMLQHLGSVKLHKFPLPAPVTRSKSSSHRSSLVVLNMRGRRTGRTRYAGYLIVRLSKPLSARYLCVVIVASLSLSCLRFFCGLPALVAREALTPPMRRIWITSGFRIMSFCWITAALSPTGGRAFRRDAIQT